MFELFSFIYIFSLAFCSSFTGTAHHKDFLSKFAFSTQSISLTVKGGRECMLVLHHNYIGALCPFIFLISFCQWLGLSSSGMFPITGMSPTRFQRIICHCAPNYIWDTTASILSTICYLLRACSWMNLRHNQGLVKHIGGCFLCG